MIKNIILTATTLVFLTASTSVQAQKKKKQVKSAVAKNDVKFLEDITVDAGPAPSAEVKENSGGPQFTVNPQTSSSSANNTSAFIEDAGSLQFKYALLLDLEVEQVQNIQLFHTIDEWMGIRYKLGGNSKDGIDCSALMQNFFSSLYGISLPRTAKEQFSFSRRISRTELKEGDLVFFNTVGGISHVGMYLQNNKFVHASSNGVTISDLFDDYWMKRFAGIGRLDLQSTASATKP